MLKSFENCVTLVNTKKPGSVVVRGNIAVQKTENNSLKVFHYNNLVAEVFPVFKKIIKSEKFWNYSVSTTRLCNDIIKYFDLGGRC